MTFAEIAALHPKCSPGRVTAATRRAIQELSLPSEYATFLAEANGMEGFLNDGRYIALWAAEELKEAGHGYGVTSALPGIQLIGNNGGGIGLGVGGGGDYVEFDFIGLELERVRWLGSTLRDLLENCLRHD